MLNKKKKSKQQRKMGQDELDMQINPVRDSLVLSTWYLIFGGLWILFSDRILMKLIPDNQVLFANISTYKGWLYVVVTTGLIFWLIYGKLIRLEKADKRISDGYKLLTSTNEELITLQEELKHQYDALEENQERLYHTAYFDVLTGLPNRSYLELNESKILKFDTPEKSSGVVFVDIDDFKYINDRFGTKKADEIICKIAEVLKNLKDDNCFVARIGGDDFIFVVNNLESEEELLQMLGRIREQISNPWNLHEEDVFITVSMGVSIALDKHTSIGELIQQAETALNEAKKEGKNDYRFYIETMHIKSEVYLRMIHSIRKAIEYDEFSVNFQPKVDLATSKIIGMEALIRWKHPDDGYISPSEFIPAAEASGLILIIDEWVIDQVIRQLVKWKSEGIEDLCISVNLSAKSLMNHGLVERVKEVLEVNHLDPECIHFEITETVLIEQLEEATHILGKLRNLGIGIELDDFGTGYSSLAYLKLLPINVLKIDREFVCHLRRGTSDHAIVNTIINLAHDLDLSVVAEGIETIEQKDILLEGGCDYAQGYYYYKPMSITQIDHLLKRQ